MTLPPLDVRLRHPLPDLSPEPFTLTSLGGLRAAGVACGIKASGRPDLALLVAERALPVAGLFTQNAFAAAPVRVCQEHLTATQGRLRALVVNSGNANACTGAQGLSDAREACALVARAVGCDPAEVLVCSTGVIGQALPMDRVRRGIAQALEALSADTEAGRSFLHAIMTTDAFPKEASRVLASGALAAGVCKGAGMIDPSMATMLAFVGMDLTVDAGALRAALPTIAARSFNAVHVDTHASTNDTFLAFSTGRRAGAEGWQDAVGAVAERLAWQLARDGEGATKVTTITVRGARDDEAARSLARRVARSALVRTALYGNDPNWGRFVSQVGNGPELGDPSRVRCTLQGIVVFDRGEPAAFDRAAASSAMAREDVSLVIDLGDGAGEGRVLTSDLGYRYIEVNAEYTT
jgi:glutamate N-acetyltransferase/amino-acid N-acetyltransferase